MISRWGMDCRAAPPWAEYRPGWLPDAGQTQLEVNVHDLPSGRLSCGQITYSWFSPDQAGCYRQLVFNLYGLLADQRHVQKEPEAAMRRGSIKFLYGFRSVGLCPAHHRSFRARHRGPNKPSAHSFPSRAKFQLGDGLFSPKRSISPPTQGHLSFPCTLKQPQSERKMNMAQACQGRPKLYDEAVTSTIPAPRISGSIESPSCLIQNFIGWSCVEDGRATDEPHNDAIRVALSRFAIRQKSPNMFRPELFPRRGPSRTCATPMPMAQTLSMRASRATACGYATTNSGSRESGSRHQRGPCPSASSVLWVANHPAPQPKLKTFIRDMRPVVDMKPGCTHHKSDPGPSR